MRQTKEKIKEQFYSLNALEIKIMAATFQYRLLGIDRTINNLREASKLVSDGEMDIGQEYIGSYRIEEGDTEAKMIFFAAAIEDLNKERECLIRVKEKLSSFVSLAEDLDESILGLDNVYKLTGERYYISTESPNQV